MPKIGMSLAVEKRPGVYRLQNIVTGRFYIGSSVNVYKRYYRHRQVLREGLKENIRISEDCEKHGIKSFVFGVIEYCEKQDLKMREQYYFELTKPAYNVWKNIYSAAGRDFTPEQMNGFQKTSNHVKNKEDHKRNMKEAWILRRQSPDYQKGIDKMVEGKKGYKHSEETKKKMSESGKGKKKPEGFSEKLRQIRLNDSKELKEYRTQKIIEARRRINV